MLPGLEHLVYPSESRSDALVTQQSFEWISSYRSHINDEGKALVIFIQSVQK
jgi:hypothetical protein